MYIPRVQVGQLVLVGGDLLLHDLARVPPELLPLPRQPLPLLPVVVQEAAQVPQLLVVPALINVPGIRWSKLKELQRTSVTVTVAYRDIRGIYMRILMDVTVSARLQISALMLKCCQVLRP